MYEFRSGRRGGSVRVDMDGHLVAQLRLCARSDVVSDWLIKPRKDSFPNRWLLLVNGSYLLS
jgi:hypothetical protein